MFIMGLLKSSDIVLGNTLRIHGVLGLGARVVRSCIPVWVEGRAWGGTGFSWCDTPRLRAANCLAGLPLHARYSMDVSGRDSCKRGNGEQDTRNYRD